MRFGVGIGPDLVNLPRFEADFILTGLDAHGVATVLQWRRLHKGRSI
jgi:hypothetical protein